MTPSPFYLTGGAIRDRLLGIPCKDLDYAVELPSMEALKEAILELGGKIFDEQPKFVTIRAKIPGLGACDYALCREDGNYDDGRHPNEVSISNDILKDLARRDFTMGAIAQQVGSDVLLDPYDGQSDIKNKIIRCVGVTEKRMSEDSLRIIRAVRFAVTKGFAFAPELDNFMSKQSSADLLENTSTQRIRDELFKCFQFDTLKTLAVLDKYWRVKNHCFSRQIRLVPTMF